MHTSDAVASKIKQESFPLINDPPFQAFVTDRQDYPFKGLLLKVLSRLHGVEADLSDLGASPPLHSSFSCTGISHWES
jgi:hypothetical protein